MNADTQFKGMLIFSDLDFSPFPHVSQHIFCSVYYMKCMIGIVHGKPTGAEVSIPDRLYFFYFMFLQDMIKGAETGMDFFHEKFGTQLFADKRKIHKIGEHNGDLAK